ncbi:MAG: hypothetical protein WBD45_22400 [Terriglobales bacterium]
MNLLTVLNDFHGDGLKLATAAAATAAGQSEERCGQEGDERFEFAHGDLLGLLREILALLFSLDAQGGLRGSPKTL